MGVPTSDSLRSALLHHFGYPDFRPGQEALVRAALEGRDAVGLLPTGGGKSVTYLLPAALGRGVTLVVSPLVSLMADQRRRGIEARLRTEALHSGVSARERRDILGRALAGDLDVLLLAPERLGSPTLAPLLDSGQVGRVAVDEAHCIIQWGFDFRPAYLALAGIGRRLRCPVLAVTATATPEVRVGIERVLGLRRPVRVRQSFDRPNLAWRVRRVRGEGARSAALVELLGRPGPALVYAPTRRSVEAVRDALARLGFGAEAYHAGLSDPERSRIQDRFIAGEVRLVVATNAFGMGVDKADVRQVVHWAPPGSIEAWYQEAGRAGRDGEPAACTVLWHPEDLRLQRRLASSGATDRDGADDARAGERRRWARARARRLRALGRFLRGRRCRRAVVLDYLGEDDPPRSCAACDRCAGPSSL
ncbi:RecQ family ATP-dependent DNA helicase [Gaopeijia maritima]|uniref:RecQ family ATP-dependent DNA helicase n=1 Tax=Gaopeijia maritima TaxID=3119007 RepID=UPI0032553B96